jgi:transposase
MRLYTAFDLHSNNSYLGIVDESGKRVFKRKLLNDPAIIIETLKPFKEDIAGIAVESTYNWYWLIDLLMAEGYKVHLANPAEIQKYTGLKYADDQHDAFWLTGCFGSASCLKDISIRRRIGRSAIFCESEGIWYGSGPH